MLPVVDLRKTRRRLWAVQHRWVRVWGSHITYRRSEYGYEGSVTEVTEVAGMILWHGCTELTEVPSRYKMLYPYPGYSWHGRTDLKEVPGTGMNVEHNLQKFFVG